MAEEAPTRASHRSVRTDQETDFAITREPLDGASAPGDGPRASRRPAGDAHAQGAGQVGPPLPYPARIASRYYLVPSADEKAGWRRAYADQHGEYLVFKDGGSRLSTRQEDAGVVRDLVAIAEHRGWPAIHAAGSSAFRREVWLEATVRGLSVSGYDPTNLDHQALEKRRPDRAARSASARANGAERWTDSVHAREADAGTPRPIDPRPSTRDRSDPTVNYDQGLSGRLVELASAPYRDREGAERATYLELELSSGRRHRLWGNGLRAAMRASGVQPGEHIHVRRTGFEVVPKTFARTGADKALPAEQHPVRRSRWVIERDRFQSLPPREAIRDPNLAAAHSHLAVLERALMRAVPADAALRDTVLTVARERLNLHLSRGTTIRRAEYAVPLRDKAAERSPERAHPIDAGPPDRARRSVRERDR